MSFWRNISRKPTASTRSVMSATTSRKTLVQVLKECGDNLTRENVMKQAASLKDFRTDGLLPGIKINTGADDFAADLSCS